MRVQKANITPVVATQATVNRETVLTNVKESAEAEASNQVEEDKEELSNDERNRKLFLKSGLLKHNNKCSI